MTPFFPFLKGMGVDLDQMLSHDGFTDMVDIIVGHRIPILM
jgi:hypothetical protein